MGTRGATGFLLLGLGRRQHDLQLVGPGEAVGRTAAALPQGAVSGDSKAGLTAPRTPRGTNNAQRGLAHPAATWQEDGAHQPHSGGGTGPRAGRPGSCRGLEALPAPGHRRALPGSGCISNFRHPGASVTSGVWVLRALLAPGRARWREAGSEARQAGIAVRSCPIVLCRRLQGQLWLRGACRQEGASPVEPCAAQDAGTEQGRLPDPASPPRLRRRALLQEALRGCSWPAVTSGIAARRRQTGTGRRPLTPPCWSQSSPQTTRRRPHSSLAGRPRDRGHPAAGSLTSSVPRSHPEAAFGL